MILIVGFGNVLRRDDGFGVCLLKQLEERGRWPEDVRLLEAGIGGITMVQELLSPADALIVLDAFRGGPTGTMRVIEVSVDDDRLHTVGVPRDYLADIHYVEPGKAIALARGIGVLPGRVYMVGAVGRHFDLGEDLSPEVASCLDEGETIVRDLVSSLRD